MLRTLTSVAIAGGLLLSAGIASAKNHRFAGIHPVAKKHGKGMCYLEFPHVHAYSPDNRKALYRPHAEWNVFVGDPVAHGYDGDHQSFHGAHPIEPASNVVAVSVNVDAPAQPADWCFIRGPHFHAFGPPAKAKFEVKGDVHWYVGTYPENWKKLRSRHGRVNAVYKPMKYHRPVVEVEPPAAYVDVFVATPHLDVHVGTPGVVTEVVVPNARIDVHGPTPTLEVSIGGTLGFGGHGHAHGKHKKLKRHRKHRARGKHKKHKKYKRGHRKHKVRVGHRYRD